MKKKFSELKLKPNERKAIKEFSKRVKEELGDEHISTFLFGSILTSKYNKDSDIDIFILVRKQTNTVLKIIAGAASDMWWKYEAFLSPVMYDEYEQERNLEMRSPFFVSLYKTGIKI
ncbi:MAG: nucleotidyltransferase domain-containing protein [Ignavibacteriae bacterium]|nr:nucleotidyltransferase domain-containing protein [Ignavibacteriota bacterium]